MEAHVIDELVSFDALMFLFQQYAEKRTSLLQVTLVTIRRKGRCKPPRGD
jgi:hypothetical protein